MNAVAEAIRGGCDPLRDFARAAAGDLLLLAMLHDRELTRELVLELWRDGYDELLGVRLEGDRGKEALVIFREGLTEIPVGRGREAMDRLAADFADIYLNHGIGASPCESVWLDDDGLAMQEPMFQVREWYRRFGLAVEDWRKRSDDHLVSQLGFVAHLLDPEEGEPRPVDAARFLDEHLLRWIGDFAGRVAARCETGFYAGLALLTAAYLEELRDLLARVLDEPRPSAEEIEARMRPSQRRPQEVEGPYLPGAAPGW